MRSKGSMRASAFAVAFAVAAVAAAPASAETVDRRYDAPFLRAAGNAAGDAVVAYRPTRHDPQSGPRWRIAVRAGGGPFRAQTVGPEDIVAAVGVDAGGTGTVLGADADADRHTVLVRPVTAAGGVGDATVLAEGGYGAFNDLQLGVGANGDAAACWAGNFGAECAYRPAGGAFGRVRRFRDYVRAAGVAVDAAGTARVVLAHNISGTIVSHPRGGRWSDPAAMPGLGPPSDMAGNDRGDVAMVVRGGEDSSLVTVPAGGSPATASLRVELGVPVTVTVPDDPALTRVAGTRGERTRPLVARPSASPVTLPGAELSRRFAAAGDPAGRFAVAYGEVAAPLRLAIAAPGRPLGRPLVLDPATFAGDAAVLLDPGGGVTALWQRSDLRTLELVERRVAPDGTMTAPAVVASSPAARGAPRRRCPRRHIVRRSSAIVAGRAFLCSTETRRIAGVGTQDLPALGLALAGSTYAVLEQAFVLSDKGVYVPITRLFVRDARTGAPLPGVDPRGVLDELPERAAVRVVVTPRGGVAWAQCATGGRPVPVHPPAVRERCRRAEVSIFKLDAGDPEPVRLASGRDVDPQSLRRAGDRVTWREDGRTSSAPLS